MEPGDVRSDTSYHPMKIAGEDVLADSTIDVRIHLP